MKTNQNVVHGFHAGLASHSLAMLRAMLAMRACHLGLRTVAKAARAVTWLKPWVCWLVRSLPSQQSSSLWLPHAMWCLHQRQVCPLFSFHECGIPTWIMLGTSPRGTYVMYPYHKSHKTRALSSQECPMYIRYLITTRIHMEFPRMKIHVE
jgi:hypothetical protein